MDNNRQDRKEEKMAAYNVKSMKADEFISHEEILETLAYEPGQLVQ